VSDAEPEVSEEPAPGHDETTGKGQPQKNQPTTEELDAQVWPVQNGERIRQAKRGPGHSICNQSSGNESKPVEAIFSMGVISYRGMCY